MADPTPPRKPNQVEGNDASDPVGGQQDTDIQNNYTHMTFGEILGEQEVGKYDFDRDLAVIKNEDDYKRRLRELSSQSARIGSTGRKPLPSHKPQPTPGAINAAKPETVEKESLPPVPYPLPLDHYSGVPNPAKKRRVPSAQLPDGSVKRQKLHTAQDDTHPLRRNEFEALLGTSGGNNRSTTSNQSAMIGLSGRKSLPEYSRHKTEHKPITARESIVESMNNEISYPPVPPRWPSNDTQRPGQTSRAPTNSLSAAAGLPSARIQPLFHCSGALILPPDVRPEDDPIAPFGSRYPAKKKKRQNPPSQPRNSVSSPVARGPDAPRFRKIRKQDGNDYWCEQDDYAGEGDEE